MMTDSRDTFVRSCLFPGPGLFGGIPAGPVKMIALGTVGPGTPAPSVLDAVIRDIS
jgi:hypothetical protein